MQPMLGLDMSKASFDATLLINEKKYHQPFENTPVGFRRLSTWLEKHQVDRLHACMEATGQYGEALAEYLHQQNQLVSVVNPARIKAYGQSKFRRNKTDKADSELIAQYCLREKPMLWTPPPAILKDLQALMRRLDDLQSNYQQESNRLQSGTSMPIVVDNLNEHLTYLKDQIKSIKKAIQEHIDSHPELQYNQALLVSIVGVGKLTAAKILGEIPNISAFDSARQLAAYAGVTPSNFISGSSVHKKARISKMGNSNLRKALYMSAICAKKHNPIVREFCLRLLAAGKKPMEVICAAMHKLLHLIYGILKSRKPFDPNFLKKQGFTS
jgi:transposase